MIDAAIDWIKRNTFPDGGIIVHSRKRVPYPEVSGYYIPTLINIGERALARQYASWLCTVQLPDGSIGAPKGSFGYAFDTGQVIRGWVSVLPHMPELEAPLRRACDWLVTTADPASGRLRVPPPGGDWSLGARGEVNEGIHLYSLGPLRQAGELLGEKRYLDFVTKSAAYYLKHVELTSFDRANALGHFFAYIQEALVELGHADVARQGMASVARYQRRDGAVPGYRDVPWVCSTALAQLATVWYALGEIDRADRAVDFMSQLQNASGAFFGSYGVRANYFPAAEISWAVKYYIDAEQMRMARHFDATVGEYSSNIAPTDGRVQAVVRHARHMEGKKILDAGCGKGRYSALLLRLFPGADITAMDISTEMLKHVPSGIRTVQHGILNMPFPDNTFDLVVCIEALEHVVQIEAGIRELARVTAVDGSVLIIDKNVAKLGALDMPAWEKWFSTSDVIAEMKKAGLEPEAEFISHGSDSKPDGLFICWTGKKPGRTSSTQARRPPTEKLQGELKYWKGMIEDVTRNCISAQDKRDALLHVCRARTFERYKHDLYLNDDSFSGKALLDIGCGPHCGIIGFRGADKYGVDHLIDAYRTLGYPLDDHGVTYRNARSEQIPFPDEFFDVVLCVNALDHVDDVAQTIREISRVLKPDGCVIGQINFHKTPTITEPNCITHEELARAFRNSGLRIDNIRYQMTLAEEDEDRYYYELSKGSRKVTYQEWDLGLAITYDEARFGRPRTGPAVSVGTK